MRGVVIYKRLARRLQNDSESGWERGKWEDSGGGGNEADKRIGQGEKNLLTTFSLPLLSHESVLINIKIYIDDMMVVKFMSTSTVIEQVAIFSINQQKAIVLPSKMHHTAISNVFKWRLIATAAAVIAKCILNR